MDKMKELLLGSMKQERTWLFHELLAWFAASFNAICCLCLLSPHRHWWNWTSPIFTLLLVYMALYSRQTRKFWRKNTELILHALTCKPEVILEAYDQLLAHLSRK
jgi:hypothetical protein